MTSIKTLAAALVLSTLGTAAFAGSASADTWVLNAAACPDLREDRHDSRITTGRLLLMATSASKSAGASAAGSMCASSIRAAGTMPIATALMTTMTAGVAVMAAAIDHPE